MVLGVGSVQFERLYRCVFHYRQENRDRSSAVLEEAPPIKQPRLSDVSSSSKWILVTGDAPLEPLSVVCTCTGVYVH